MSDRLRKGIVKRIHVNQHVIRRNRKEHENEPPLTIKTSSENLRAHEVQIDGPSTLIYSPDRPLACGAHLWIETYAQLEIR